MPSAFDKHFKNLFHNMKVRHAIKQLNMETVEADLENLIRLRGIKNIFLLARCLHSHTNS